MGNFKNRQSIIDLIFLQSIPFKVKNKVRSFVCPSVTLSNVPLFNNRWNWIKNHSFIIKKWFSLYRMCRILLNAFGCSIVYLWGSKTLIEHIFGFSGILWDLSSISLDSLDSRGYYETYRAYLCILWILRDTMRLIEHTFGFSGFSGILWDLSSIPLDSLDAIELWVIKLNCINFWRSKKTRTIVRVILLVYTDRARGWNGHSLIYFNINNSQKGHCNWNINGNLPLVNFHHLPSFVLRTVSINLILARPRG